MLEYNYSGELLPNKWRSLKSGDSLPNKWEDLNSKRTVFTVLLCFFGGESALWTILKYIVYQINILII